ncbi:AAA family ATPase [Murdochiella massiliensis]|uniref:AAA family ATPase n=1 Tax=Murdochiella massiliensis TaxID=1673723 RepID=UPI00082B06C3|nr:MoxR family ATPase [Murdochiella massiliensis]MBY0584297.1 MoxR family ATPase [Murdochiella sp. Marseille-P8839]
MSLHQEAASICRKLGDDVLASIGRVVIGKEIPAKKMLICLLAGGHVLLEDVPGIGKTTLVHALAKSVRLDFQRIQFTPDLMPSDVTGFNMYNPKTAEFEFREGAVNTQILLADEINRSSPRTQSALLEAMQEGQVTVEGVTYALPKPFMVMATQNPVENVGTYPLPEAQMDRFMMRISIGYPSMEEEMEIISTNAMRRIQKDVNVVAEKEVISWLREQIPQVDVTDEVKRYMLAITRKTREEDLIELGVSPRAGQMLFSAAQTLALLNGRTYVIPEDVQALVHDVLDHRIILKPQSRGRGITTHEVIADIMNNTVVPR